MNSCSRTRLRRFFLFDITLEVLINASNTEPTSFPQLDISLGPGQTLSYNP